MRLVILGAYGYGPSNQGQTACVMLPELGLVFDAGTGLYRIRELIATPTLDIYLSHAHVDHVYGLSYLPGILWGKEVDVVRVHGEERKLTVIQQHFFASDLSSPPPVEWCPLHPQEAVPNGGQLRYFPLEHPGECIGYRLDWPEHSLAYVTDTHAQPDASYNEHIRGVDVLLHEGYLPDEEEQLAKRIGHSCPISVAKLAAATGVGRLILIHLFPFPDALKIDMEAACSIFPTIKQGYDGMEVEF